MGGCFFLHIMINFKFESVILAFHLICHKKKVTKFFYREKSNHLNNVESKNVEKEKCRKVKMSKDKSAENKNLGWCECLGVCDRLMT